MAQVHQPQQIYHQNPPLLFQATRPVILSELLIQLSRLKTNMVSKIPPVSLPCNDHSSFDAFHTKYSYMELLANRISVKPFQRAQIPIRSPLDLTHRQYQNHLCPACRQQHPLGACQLKAAGVEHCGLCGMAHFGQGRTCPHIKSETQVREMLQALKNSPEKRELVEAAVKYLRGVKGTLVQQKRKDQQKAALLAVNAQGHATMPHSVGVQNSARPVAQSQGPQAPHITQPQPGTRPSTNLVKGSIPGHTTGGQHPTSTAGPSQQQRPQHAANPGGTSIDDRVVESALRGFLGH